MGGPKKPTISQAAKRTLKEERKDQKESVPEKSVLGITIPSIEEVASFVSGLRYVTPSILAEKFGFRMSIAKDLLSRLHSKGTLRLADGDNRIRIYVPAKAEVAPSQQPKKPEEKVGKPVKKGKGKKEAIAEETAA